jgi:hypothetical protein
VPDRAASGAKTTKGMKAGRAMLEVAACVEVVVRGIVSVVEIHPRGDPNCVQVGRVKTLTARGKTVIRRKSRRPIQPLVLMRAMNRESLFCSIIMAVVRYRAILIRLARRTLI